MKNKVTDLSSPSIFVIDYSHNATFQKATKKEKSSLENVTPMRIPASVAVNDFAADINPSGDF